MQPTYVSSSNIDAVGYSLGSMCIRFRNGTSYRYSKVPYEVFSRLASAESVGQTFHQIVRGKYEYGKLQRDPFIGGQDHVQNLV